MHLAFIVFDSCCHGLFGGWTALQHYNSASGGVVGKALHALLDYLLIATADHPYVSFECRLHSAA